ncbi:hypothetical protein [Kitasatospora sp. MBT63]|uniref:hypothetical protein n=1 Tax=Kitasatospora sp. MBT63 TaxID=1444768 RepID=UPI0005398109|nr:hypothetical protein [Kitasatospora sp. MBT63]
MDDIPQGGAGGVPGHQNEHNSDRSQRVPTVRAGTPVAEQRDDKNEKGGGDQAPAGGRDQRDRDEPPR